MINTDAVDVHARCGRTILLNVDKESGERDELLSVEFVCWTLDLPVRLFTDSAADEWRRCWYHSGGCGDNAITAVKLLRGSSRKMDPLSVLGTAETILTEVNRIGDFVDAVKTNTKKCKALWERVQRLEEIAEGLNSIQNGCQASRSKA